MLWCSSRWCSGDAEEGCRNIFSALRSCEGVAGATHLLLCDPLLGRESVGDIVDGLRDRMFRSASGRVVRVQQAAQPTVWSV